MGRNTLRMTEVEYADWRRRQRSGGLPCGICGKLPCKCPKAPAKKKSARSELEQLFRDQIRAAGLPGVLQQYSPFPMENNVRVDFAKPVIPHDPHMDPQPGVIIEVQGMAHRIKAQFKSDCRRHNQLTEAGWTVYYVTGEMIRDGSAIELAERVFRG